jgi:hypothetical protein
MQDLTTKPCKCGGTMGEILGFVERSTDGKNIPYRRLWWCKVCNRSAMQRITALAEKCTSNGHLKIKSNKCLTAVR